ncbi:efflux transporter outer membrane factor lipoprotein NodT family [Prevotella sp. CAG:474]|nr:efflux transporter outer membrane factor lipoprotein NodT family [Prevotella sp. CAG:474]
MAFTNLFPRITLTANYGLESKQMSDFFKSPIHYLGANLLGPLFAMGKNRAMLKAQKAAYEQACYGYEKAVLSAFKLCSLQKLRIYSLLSIFVSRPYIGCPLKCVPLSMVT